MSRRTFLSCGHSRSDPLLRSAHSASLPGRTRAELGTVRGLGRLMTTAADAGIDGFEFVVGDGMDDEGVEAYSDADIREYDYDDDDICFASPAEARRSRPETEAEALKRAILDSAREAGALANEDADWDEAVGDDALAARLGQEHDEHIAHNLASISKDKIAPSSRVDDKGSPTVDGDGHEFIGVGGDGGGASGGGSVRFIVRDGRQVIKRWNVMGVRFDVDVKYLLLDVVGQGAYGVVCAARDEASGDNVAIKKITNAFEHELYAKRTLREIRLLR